MANQEAVRILKGWCFALYVVNFLVCVMFGLPKNLSVPQVLWLLAQSLFWSYVVGFIVLVVGVRYFGGTIGIKRITHVGMLRCCVVFAFVSVIIGAILVYQQPAIPTPVESHP